MGFYADTLIRAMRLADRAVDMGWRMLRVNCSPVQRAVGFDANVGVDRDPIGADVVYRLQRWCDGIRNPAAANAMGRDGNPV